MRSRKGPPAPGLGRPSSPGAAPGGQAPAPDALAQAAHAAGARGDVRTLARLHPLVLDAARRAPPGDLAVADPLQHLLRAWVQAGRPDRAIDLARDAYDALGYDRLVSPEVTLRAAAGDLDGARALAEELADAPVGFGGHGPRAFVRELLGRYADAVADGAAFHEEAMEVRRSLAAWRAVAGRYAPATAQLLGRHGSTCLALEAAFPGARPWRGEPLAGGTVAVELTEGYGDQIQGLRLARAVRCAGARALVGCDPPVADLVRAAGAADDLMPRPVAPRAGAGPAGGEAGADEPVGWYVAAGARLYETGILAAYWPWPPYLALGDADGADAAEPPALAGLGRPRVGLLWAGNPAFPLEAMRALPPDALHRLIAATPDVAWVSLQRDDHPRAAELDRTPAGRRVRRAGGAIHSFLDTARLMRHLDMVVCTDTAPAHLAGALGVPTRVLLGASADWRWGIGRAGTPLYPSVRLVRDGTRGDWAAAVDRVAAELAAWGGPPPRGPGPGGPGPA